MDAKIAEIEAWSERDAGMDWEQVRQNGGPPCFHTMKEGVLCGRAKRWPGHGKADHEYMSLADLLRESEERKKSLVEALREKRVEHLWIPVSERLPIARATVYVAVVSKPDKSVFVTEGYVSEGEWYFLSVDGESAFAEYGWVPEYWMAKYIEPQPPAALLALYPVEPAKEESHD